MGKQIAEDGNAAVGSQGYQRQGEVIIAGIEGESITKFQQVLMNEAKIGTGFLKADDIINFGKFPAALHIDGHPGTGRNIIEDDRERCGDASRAKCDCKPLGVHLL